MRNLKKALSLALALVMLLGMMVVGAGAAKFEDFDKIDEKYQTAAAVLEKIGVMEGTDGVFNPNEELNRVQGAAIIYRLVTGGLVMRPSGVSGFADVDDSPSYNWASGIVAACRDLEIIGGVGDNKFAPGDKLTVAAFAKMLLCTLEYNAEKAGYNTTEWEANVARDARTRGILLNELTIKSNLTREQAAQMAFQALTAEMVEYTGPSISLGGATVSTPATVRRHSANVSGGSVNYTYDLEPVQSNITPVRLCEEKFPELKLDRLGSEDKFGCTYKVWTWKNVEIEDTKVEVGVGAEFTKKTGKADVATAINDATSYGDPVPVWVNGERSYETMNATKVAALTQNGRLVQVYLNNKNLKEIEKVVVIDTALAEVTKVIDKDEKISVKLAKSAVTDGPVVLTTTEGYGDVKVGDLVLVQGYDNDADKVNTKLNKNTKITSVELAEVVTGPVTQKKFDDSTATGKAQYLLISGEKRYDAYGVMDGYDVANFDLNTEYDDILYLDQYGYIMKAVEGKETKIVTDNLIAVKEVYRTLSGNKIVDMVKGVISNGDTVDWELESNTDVKPYGIYNWSKDNGKYTLARVDTNKIDSTIKDKDTENTYVANVYAKGDEVSFRANDVYGQANGSSHMYSDSVKFIFVDSANEGVTVLSGRQNYDFKAAGKQVIAQALKNGEITAVFVESDAGVANLDDVIYVFSRRNASDERVTTEDGKTVIYYGYEAYKSDGTEIEDYLAEETGMANKFFVASQNSYGAYKNYHPNMLKNHTMTNGVVRTANGLGGDAFLLYEFEYNDTAKKDVASGDVFEFQGRKSTTVRDLSGSGLYIDSISELNRAVNDGRKVTIAVIYNDTNSKPQHAAGTGKDYIKSPVTIFVTEVGKPDSIKDVDWGDGAGTVSVKFSGTATKDTDYTVTGPVDKKYTVTAKDGANISVVSGTGYTASKNADGTWTVTIIATTGTVDVKVNKTSAGTGSVKFAADAKDREAKITMGTATLNPSNGKVHLALQLTAPSWARPDRTAAAKFQVKVFVNNEQANVPADITFGTVTAYAAASGSAAEKLATLSYDNDLAAYASQGDDIRVEITEVKYDIVEVQLVDKDSGKAITIASNGTIKTGNSAQVATTFTTTDTTAAAALPAKILSGATATTVTATPSRGTVTLATTGIAVTGDGAVKIEVDTSSLTELFKLTAETATLISGAGAKVSDLVSAMTQADDKIQITADPAAATAGGVKSKVNVYAEITAGSNAAYYSYSVEIAGINDGKPVEIVGAAKKLIGQIDLTSANHEIKNADIKITGVEAQAIKSANYKDKVLTIEFVHEVDKNKLIDSAFTLTGAAGTIDYNTIDVTGKTVKITFLADPTASTTANKVTLNKAAFADKAHPADAAGSGGNQLGAKNNIVFTAIDGTALTVN